MVTFVEALLHCGLLDATMQRSRMDNLQAMNPALPSSSHGLGIARFDSL